MTLPLNKGVLPASPERRRLVLLGLVSVAIIAAVLQIQGRLGFSLSDEGYLWYGAQRVLLGEIPRIDFQAYDPGRYYCAAAIMSLLDDNGIVALRIAVSIFQGLGLFLALAMIMSVRRRTNMLLMLLAAGIFGLWMYPWHKLFDITISISLVAALVKLIEYPSCRRYFVTGMLVGLAATFGRNHGLYGVIGSLGVIAYLVRFRGQGAGFLSPLRWLSAGLVVGYLPILTALLFLPNFAGAFWESIRFYSDLKGTNLSLPIPWPWRVQFLDVPWLDAVRGVLIGLFFIAIPTFGILGISHVMRSRLREVEPSPVLVGSVFMVLPYAHHAFSRADVGHLAQGIFPFLIGLLALVARKSFKTTILVAVLLFGTSLLVMLPLQPGWRALREGGWQLVPVGRDQLKVDRGTANDLKLLHSLADKYAGDGRTFMATPFWPGAYAVLERRSPMWEIYALFPRSTAFQEAEIQRIQKADPAFVVVLDQALDGREDLRFRNTHPLIERYIKQNFEPVTESLAPVNLQIYRDTQIVQ